MKIDLTKFCDPESCRYAVGLPWQFWGANLTERLWGATDYRIAIACDIGMYDGPPDGAEGRKPKILEVMKPRDWPGYTNPLPIDTQECHFCRLTGEIKEIDPMEVEIVNTRAQCVVKFGELTIVRKYYNLIRDLPGITWGIDGDEISKMIFFRFDGGHGTVMTIDLERTR